MPDSVPFRLGTLTVICKGAGTAGRDAPLAWPVSVSVVSHGNGMQEAARVSGQLQRVRWD